MVGAGQVARDLVRALAKQKRCNLVIVNRSGERAVELAGETGATAAPFERLAEICQSASIVVAATAAATPILGPRELDLLPRESGRGLLVIDAGLPHNVSSGVAAEVLDIDCIRERQGRALEQRQAAVPAVEALIASEIERFKIWSVRQAAEPAIRRLFADAEAFERSLQTHGSAVDFGRVRHQLDRHARRVRGLPPRGSRRQRAMASA